MPGKTNPERRKRIEKMYKQGMIMKDIAKEEGIHIKTVFQYIHGWTNKYA